MTFQDTTNGSFELIGGLMSLLNVRTVYRAKAVQGVSIWASAFFTLWGFWNLYYYPSLGQYFSFLGALVIVTGNTGWVGLAAFYSLRDRVHPFI